MHFRSLTDRLQVIITMAVMASASTMVAGESSPSATNLMRQAHDARAVWENFPGFTAAVAVRDNEATYSGQIEVSADLSYSLTGFNEAQVSWLSRKLHSVVGHRRATPFRDRGYQFAPESTVAGAGRLIAQEDGSGVFRVEDGMISEVHRRSDTRWLEISNLKQKRTKDGRLLPQVSAVTYRDPKSGAIDSNRCNTFEWVRVGDFELPRRTFTVETSSTGGRSVREVMFSDHVLCSTSDQPTIARSVLHQPLKESLTSFGAAVLDEYLYVFGGHDGDAHGFGADLLANHFRRIRFDDPNAEWEELAMHPPAQSVALVSDGRYLYRIAGLSFRNSGTDEETDFDSTDHFARYDPETNEWTALQPLPESRSSLDAAVVGRSIFVAGGWNLQRESSRDAPWHDTLLRFDLDSPDAGWRELEGPGYSTRALSVAAHNGKLWVLGGIQERGITRQASVYDPTTGAWAAGPELKPDSRTAGFATSSFATGGRLYYTGSSGVIYRLSEDEGSWEAVDRLMFPRMFLRLLPAGEGRLIALGGTGSATGRTAAVESIRVDGQASSEDKMFHWSIPYSGRARHSQGLLLDGTRLYAFGGNASAAPHDFSKEAFVKEAFVFDLTRRTVEQLPDMPLAVQSGAAVVNSKTSEHETILLVGGMSHLDGQFQAVPHVLEYAPEGGSWSDLASQLPEPRTMHSVVTHEDAIWVFGGSQVGEDRGQLDTIVHWWGDESQPAPLPGTALPTTRRSFGLASLNGSCYIVGGLTADTGIAETVDVFNFEDRKWTQAPAPAVARVFPSVATDGNVIYLFGGFSRADGHFAPAPSLEKFDDETQQWTTVTNELPGVTPSMRMFSLGGAAAVLRNQQRRKISRLRAVRPGPAD